MRPALQLIMMLAVAGCGGNPPGEDHDAGVDVVGDPWFPCEECDDGDPCTMGRCNPLTMICENVPLDRDGDRYAARSAQDGTPCGGIDCDDDDPAVHPGAREVCADGVDQDCDDVVDGFGMIGEPVIASMAPIDSYYPDVVWTGSEFAVSWVDMSRTFSESIIHLSFVSAEGELVDDTQVAFETEVFHSLLWTGSHLVLAWSDLSGGLSLLGMLPDGTEQWTAEDVLVQDEFSIVWTGSRFAALWRGSGSSGENDIWFMLMDDAGTPVSAEIGVDDDLVEGEWEITLEWTGSAFLAAWLGYDAGYRDVWVRSIGPLGSLSGPSRPLTTRGDVYSPSRIAWTGSGFGITTGNDIYGVFLMRADREAYLLGEPTRVSPPGQRPTGFDVIWAGSVFAVSWAADSFYEATPAIALVDPDGEVVSDVVYTSRESTADAARWDSETIYSMAWTGSEIGLVWTDWRIDAETMDCNTERCESLVHLARLGWCE